MVGTLAVSANYQDEDESGWPGQKMARQDTQWCTPLEHFPYIMTVQRGVLWQALLQQIRSYGYSNVRLVGSEREGQVRRQDGRQKATRESTE